MSVHGRTLLVRLGLLVLGIFHHNGRRFSDLGEKSSGSWRKEGSTITHLLGLGALRLLLALVVLDLLLLGDALGLLVGRLSSHTRVASNLHVLEHIHDLLAEVLRRHIARNFLGELGTSLPKGVEQVPSDGATNKSSLVGDQVRLRSSEIFDEVLRGRTYSILKGAFKDLSAKAAVVGRGLNALEVREGLAERRTSSLERSVGRSHEGEKYWSTSKN